MTTYFISDIHLSSRSSENSNLLLEFLRNTAPQTDALYILGDLFAIWFGDDLDYSFVTEIVQALQNLHDMKIPVYFMHGNRDFLISKNFCSVTGMQMLPDPFITTIYGKKVLLTHGDLLCSQDTKYQKFRKFVQSPIIKWLFLITPKFLRIKIGNWVKNKAGSSGHLDANFDATKYDADQTTINSWFTQYNVETMIHGHTHLPALHNIGNTQRYVLGDWNKSAAIILKCEPQQFKLIDLLHPKL